MKDRILLLVALLMGVLASRAENVVSLSSVRGAPGEEVTVDVSLSNSDAVSALQLSIPLDESLTLVDGSATLSDRATNHQATIGVKGGTLNVMVFSLGMTALDGTSGNVVSFRLKLGREPQDIDLTPSKVVLTKSDGSTVTATSQNGSVSVRTAKAQYSSMSLDFGHVPIRETYTKTLTVTNVGNEPLTVTGVNFSDVNVFSSTTAFPFTLDAEASKDVNVTYQPTERGSVEKSVQVVCNSISKLNTIALKADPFAVNELHVQDASGVSDEEVTVHLTVNNMDAITGFQFEFDLPDALKYVEGSFALSDRKADHTILTTLNEGCLRAISYSSTNAAFTGNDGEIASFKVKLNGRDGTMLEARKAVLTAQIKGVTTDVLSEKYSGYVNISSPRIRANNTLNFGAVSVTEGCEKTFCINNSGNAPLTISRVVFDNENLTVKENLPIEVPAHGSKEVTVVYGSVEQKAFEATMQIYSNDPEQRLLNVAVTGSRFAPNYLEVATKDVFVDGMLTIDVSLNTYDPITGLQFDVTYPNKVFEPFEDNVTLEGRAQDMTVTARELSAGTLRYFCYFLDGNGIAAGSGKAFSIKMKPVGEEVPEGNYTIRVKNIKLGTSEMADKYAGKDTESTFKVKKHTPVTISAKSYSRKYGEANPTFAYTAEGATLVGTPDISCEATATSPVGTYPIVISKGSVTNEDDSYVNGTLTITKAPLTITPQSYVVKQGETLPTFEVAYNGFKNGETKEILTKQPIISCSATSSGVLGTYDMVVSGAEAENYDITYVNGTLSVVDADAVVVTAKSYTRKYGEANPTFEYTSAGAVLDGTPTISCEATTASPVGTYPIAISKGNVINYNDSYVNGVLTITKAPLKISAKNYTIKQGEALPTFEVTYDGFKNDETADVLIKQPTITCVATSTSTPNTYDIVVSGAEAENYEISYVAGTLTITDADAVVVTAKSYTRKYGESNPTFEFTSAGALLNGTPAISCEATTASPVGTYPIAISKGSVTNYNDSYINGTLTITKASLSITAQNYVIKQGDELPTFEVTYDGFKNDESADVLTKKPVIACTATSSDVLGTYEIVVSGAEAENYDISYVTGTLSVVDADAVVVTAKSYTREYGEANPTFEYTSAGVNLEGTPEINCEATAASPVGTYPIVVSKGSVANYNDTYINGTLTITKAPLNITAQSYVIKQGEALPTFEVVYAGFKNDESADVLTKKPVIACTATSSDVLGTYEIVVSGAEAENYDISYVTGTLSVVDADAVVVTAKSYTREYGEANPTFEYTSAGVNLEGTPEITCEATATSSVGTYPIVVSKGSVANYNDTYINGTLTITKAPLTITAQSYVIKQGEALPTFEFTYEGFKNGEKSDVLTKQPTIICAATSSSVLGTYEIVVSGAEAENYGITFVNGLLTIEAVETPVDNTFEEEGASYEKQDDGTVSFMEQENASGSVEIPETVTHDGVEYQVTAIAEGAFKDNTNLKEISIPESIASIGVDAFAGCTNLKKINLYSEEPISIDQADASSVFSGVDTENCTLYVPAGSAEAYRQADGWKAFKNIVEMEDPDEISDVNADNGEYRIYTLDGKPVEALQKGVNIIRHSNGATQKVFVK